MTKQKKGKNIVMASLEDTFIPGSLVEQVRFINGINVDGDRVGKAVLEGLAHLGEAARIGIYITLAYREIIEPVYKLLMH